MRVMSAAIALNRMDYDKLPRWTPVGFERGTAAPHGDW
jgi:hypothetical protein